MEINQNLRESREKNNAMVVIIVILVVVICIAGYFAYKYYTQRNNDQTSSSIPTSLETPTKLDTGNVINLLRYPQAETLTNGKKVSDTQVNDFTMQTHDSVAVVYNYYMGLFEENHWSLGSYNIGADEKTAYVSIKEVNFQAEIAIESMLPENITSIVIDIKTGNFTASDNFDYKTATPTASSTALLSSPEAKKNDNTSEEKVSITSDYVISDSNTRVIETTELESLSPWELKVARNEIYARHGREFVHQDLQCYFDNKSWYSKNNNFSDGDLTSTEIKNISIILDYEKSIDSPVMNKDLGC